VSDERSLTVLIHDRRVQRRARLQALIVAAGAAPLLADARDVEGAPALALVAVDGDGEASDEDALRSALPIVRALSRRSMTILAYGDGVERWPLAQRCRILLAGAPVLLDLTGPRRDGPLQAQLSKRLDLRRNADRADQRIVRVAAQLGIVGNTEILRESLAAVERSAAFSDMPVLLLGETGTGKELLARAVHLLDPRRRDCPFVALNCAALTRTLAEAELFGHRKGAFTGAERERPGLVRAAHGGVLFLDEIGELDLELQAKLLRVLQERRVRSVGDTAETPVDVRIVAATHRDLRGMVREQRFRADLLARLWVYPIQLAPLRRRRDDIPALIHHFVGKHAPSRPVTVEPAFTQALQQVRLEGNVRQLENIVQRALAAADTTLGLGQLPPEIWTELAALDEPAGEGRALGPAPDDLNLTRALASHERELVMIALRRSGGNQTRAAGLLGITARTMYNKLRKHQLEPSGQPGSPDPVDHVSSQVCPGPTGRPAAT
jgi:transcriptional regulator with GAF, ATPase, and Fis domain